MELVRKTTRNRLVTSHLPSKVSIEGSCSLQGACCVRRVVDGRYKYRKALSWLCVPQAWQLYWLCSRALEPAAEAG